MILCIHKRVGSRILPFLCTISFLLLASCNYFKEPDPYEWQSFGLEGKRVFELTVSENFLYAASGKNGLYRKNLSEESNEWEYLGLAEPEVNFGVRTFYRNHETGIMYAGFFEYNWDGPGLFRSIDGGESWDSLVGGITERYSGDSAFLTKLSAPNGQPSKIFAGTWAALFRLNEENTEWEYLDDNDEFGKGIFSISFNPDNHQEIWVGGRSGFESARLLKSQDGGNTWTNKTGSITEFTEGLDEVNAITIHPNNPDIIYICLFRKIIKTTDGGNSWLQLTSDLNSENEFNDPDLDSFSYFKDLSINPADPNEILAAGKYLYQSQDAGSTWQVVSDTTRQGVIDFKVDWGDRVVYGYIISPEKGVFKVKF